MIVLFITTLSFVTVYMYAIGRCNLFQKYNLFQHIISVRKGALKITKHQHYHNLICNIKLTLYNIKMLGKQIKLYFYVPMTQISFIFSILILGHVC